MNLVAIQEWSPVVEIVGIILAILTAQWRLSSWLGKQFDSVKDLVYTMEDRILDKLEYHERHDDQRFADINNNLVKIQLGIRCRKEEKVN